MQFTDYVILFAYLIGIFLVGVLLSFKNKSSEDMFAAGGESPWWTSGLSAFMTMFSAAGLRPLNCLLLPAGVFSRAGPCR